MVKRRDNGEGKSMAWYIVGDRGTLCWVELDCYFVVGRRRERRGSKRVWHAVSGYDYG